MVPRNAAVTSTAAGSSPWSTARTSPTPPARTPMPPTRATTTGRGAGRPPHDWSIELDPTTDATDSETGFLQGGLGWYRKTFTLPRSAARKSVSLEFDGIYMDSVVFLNGKQVASPPVRLHRLRGRSHGAHTDGHTPNVVAVEVRNKHPEQPLVLRQRHLPQRAPRRHRPVHVARHGDVRDHARCREHVQAGLRERERAHRRHGGDRRHPSSVVTTFTDARGRRRDGRPASPQDGSADQRPAPRAIRTSGRPTTPTSTC